MNPMPMAKSEPPESENLHSLYLKISQGDKKAEALFFKQYWKRLYLIIYQRCQDEYAAEDFAQEALLAVLSSIREGKINKPEALFSYMRNTAINIYLADIRKKNRQATDANENMDLFSDVEKDTLIHKISNVKMLNVVSTLINELPQSRDRQIIRNYYQYGKSKKIICSELGLTPAQFDRILHRARKRLRELTSKTFKLNSQNAITSLMLMVSITGLLLNAQSSIQQNNVLFHFKVRDSDLPTHYSMANIKIAPAIRLIAETLKEKGYENR